MSQQQAIEQAIISLDKQIRDLELTREALAATLPTRAKGKKVTIKPLEEYIKGREDERRKNRLITFDANLDRNH